MEMNFCRRCGTALTRKSETFYTCENSHRLYTNAAPTVGIFFVTDDNHVLLSVRGIEPFKGALDSFGGFVDGMETAEQAIVREVEEELGLARDQYSEPVFLSTETGLYPFDGEDRSIFSVFFWSRLNSGATPVPADDVASIEIVPLDNVDLDKMDNVDVRAAIQKLQKLLLK